MLNLDEMIAQREEATGVDGGRVPFIFKGKTFSFKDPLSLSDDEKATLQELDLDIDIAEFFLDDQWEAFVKAGGSSSLFVQVFEAHENQVQEYKEDKGKARSSRSQKRQAASRR